MNWPWIRKYKRMVVKYLDSYRKFFLMSVLVLIQNTNKFLKEKEIVYRSKDEFLKVWVILVFHYWAAWEK